MQNPVDARWTLPLWLQSLTTVGKRSEGDTALRWRSISLPGRRRRARAAEPHSPPRRLSTYTQFDRVVPSVFAPRPQSQFASESSGQMPKQVGRRCHTFRPSTVFPG
jgi:hypothetical protein